MVKVIASIIVLAGVSLLVGLWPLPAQQAAQFKERAAAELAASDPSDSPTTFNAARRQYYQSVVDDQDIETQFRVRWAITLALSACCVAAGVLMFFKARFWAVAVVISAVFYASFTEFVWPLYEIFFRGTSSLDQFLSRVAIFGHSLEMAAIIAWYNLAVPCAFMVAVAMASWSAFARLFHRRRTDNNAL